jgi:hypothetical protein
VAHDPTTSAKRRLQQATAALAIAQDNKRRTELADDAAACALARAAAERDSAVRAVREMEAADVE